MTWRVYLGRAYEVKHKRDTMYPQLDTARDFETRDEAFAFLIAEKRAEVEMAEKSLASAQRSLRAAEKRWTE